MKKDKRECYYSVRLIYQSEMNSPNRTIAINSLVIQVVFDIICVIKLRKLIYNAMIPKRVNY